MGQTSCLNLYPWRSQSWGPFPPLPDALYPAKAGTSAWNPWMDPCQALLGGDRSSTRGWALCSEKQPLGKQDYFFPSHVLAPCHHVPPQNSPFLNHPNSSTHKKLCATPTGTALELPKEADKPKHPAAKREGAAGTQHPAALPRDGEGTWQSLCIPRSAQH